MSAVTVRNLFKEYDGKPIIERVNLEIEEGAFCSIVGASGCGKSTFLRLVLAQETPTRGLIQVGDAPPAREPGPDRGVVFQRYSVFPHLTVRGNVMLGDEFGAGFLGRWRRRAQRRAEADAVLERVGLSHMADAWPSQLSGGMQQRLAIAQALVMKPRVLLLDEPFGALDPGTRARMHEFILELWREEKMTILMVSHDLSEAFSLGTRVLVFDKPRWDPTDPSAYGATITYDFKLHEKKLREGGEPDEIRFGPPDDAPRRLDAPVPAVGAPAASP